MRTHRQLFGRSNRKGTLHRVGFYEEDDAGCDVRIDRDGKGTVDTSLKDLAGHAVRGRRRHAGRSAQGRPAGRPLPVPPAMPGDVLPERNPSGAGSGRSSTRRKEERTGPSSARTPTSPSAPGTAPPPTSGRSTWCATRRGRALTTPSCAPSAGWPRSRSGTPTTVGPGEGSGMGPHPCASR